MRDQHAEQTATPAAVRALSNIMVGDGDRDAILRRACEAAKSVIAGADEVSVTLISDRPRTVASTGELAMRADTMQYKADQGPCLEAATEGRPVLVGDLSSDDRWPEYANPALSVGVRGSLSVPIQLGGDATGALNIYARRPGAFTADEVDGAYDLAQYAGIVASATEQRNQAVSLAQQLQEAMESRAVIEQAKGILMQQRHCGADEAFQTLVRLSQESHRKLRDIAQMLVAEVTKT